MKDELPPLPSFDEYETHVEPLAKLWPYQEDAIKRMAGIGRNVEVNGKVFFRTGTALTSSPKLMAFAMAGKPDDDA